MTLATKITLTRIIFIPLFVALFYIPEFMLRTDTAYLLAGWLFIILSATDWLDGYIARTYNQVSDLGKFLDPLADKVLVFSAMILLLPLGLYPAWAIIIMLAREFIISGVRMMAALNDVVIAADIFGKIKTVTQMASIVAAFFILIFEFDVYLLLYALVFISTISALFSGYSYCANYLKQNGKAK